ncbi:hypothetical protein [Pedobacter gandavensis]|uniref:hypothetical protein n=1 Tax=Pedobacter gandavensis TaxID=2679963 RepID=UPI002931E18F|nr:hypothetical protein [Pedobacter gandavensis]
MTNYKWSILNGLILLALSGYAQDKKTVPFEKPLTQFNDQNPVFKLKAEQVENKHRHLHFYALTGYREGVKPIVSQFNVNFLAQKDEEHGTHRIKMYNLSITDMLTYGLIKSNEVILEVRDSSKYRYNPRYGSKQRWLRKNAYCYELLLPENTLKSANVVRNHLCSLFKVKCGYQKRLIKNVEKNIFVITEIN